MIRRPPRSTPSKDRRQRQMCIRDSNSPSFYQFLLIFIRIQTREKNCFQSFPYEFLTEKRVVPHRRTYPSSVRDISLILIQRRLLRLKSRILYANSCYIHPIFCILLQLFMQFFPQFIHKRTAVTRRNIKNRPSG